MTGMIPVIDISPLRGEKRRGDNSDALQLAQCVDAIRKACTGVGFFYVTGHGVPRESFEGVFAATERLFDLAKAEKDALGASNSPLYRGYNSIETG